MIINKKMVNDELNNLRERIDQIDEKIITLLSERNKVVEDVVKIKKSHTLPVYYPAREEDLISKRRHQSLNLGMDPDFIEDFFRGIIRQSRVTQTSHIASKAAKQNTNILIVGGLGKMGQYFNKWFKKAGYQVRILDKENWSEVSDLCKNIALTIISVPIDITEAVIKKISPHLPKDSILADITSIKSSPLKSMLNYYKGPVIGLHPLFGPTTTTMDKQIIVSTPGRNLDSCQWLLDQFSIWGGVIIQADAEEHDEIMGIVQALRHFATFVFGHFLNKKNIKLNRTLEFSSPIYRLELGMVGRLFAQDPSLYSEIIFASPYRLNILKDYIHSVNESLEMLEKNDKKLFTEEFTKIADWFGPFSEQAMRESSFLINKLIERF